MWLAWLLAGCAPPLPAQGSVHVLTYNVAGLPEGISGSHPLVDMTQIAPKLDGYDLALLQEDFAYHDDLVNGSDFPYDSGWGEPRQRTVGDGLTRFSIFPLGPTDRVQWDACNGGIDFGASDCLAEKGFSVDEVHLADGVSLLVYNLHADAGNGQADAEARASNFAQIAADIAARAGDHAVLVAGDTNLHGAADDPRILQDFLDASGTHDACRTLQCGDEHIDRFMFRSGSELTLQPTAWAVATEFVDGDGQPLSDHPAIAVTVDWQIPE